MKKKISKLLVLILCMSMVLGSVSAVWAEDVADDAFIAEEQENIEAVQEDKAEEVSDEILEADETAEEKVEGKPSLLSGVDMLSGEESEDAGVQAYSGCTAEAASWGMFPVVSSKMESIGGGSYKVTIVVNRQTYDRMYFGSVDTPAELRTPVIQGVLENGMYTYEFTATKDMIGKYIPLVTGKPDGTSWITTDGKYLMIPDPATGKASGEYLKTVEAAYVDDSGAEIADSVYLRGKKGAEYTTEAAQIEGYILKKTPENATGRFEDSTVVVFYEYVEKTDDDPETPGEGGEDGEGDETPDQPGIGSNSSTVLPDTLPEANIKFVKADGSEFTMFAMSKTAMLQTGDSVVIHLETANTSFNKIYFGPNTEADNAKCVTGTQRAEGGWSFNFEIPASYIGKTTEIALGKAKDDTFYVNQPLYMVIPEVQSNIMEDAGMNIITGGSELKYMYTAAGSSAIKMGDSILCTFVMKGTATNKLYLGKRYDSPKSPVIEGVSDGENVTYTFTVSADKQGTYIPVTVSKTASGWDTTQNFFIYIPNFDRAFDASYYEDGIYEPYGNAHSLNGNVPVDDESSVKIVGDKVKFSLVTRTSTYNKLYLGSVSDPDDVKNANAISSSDYTPVGYGYQIFELEFPKSMLGQPIPFVLCKKADGTWLTKQDQFIFEDYLVKIGDLASVVVKFQDRNGNDLADAVTVKGTEGEEYVTEPKEISGYEVAETPSNATGVYTEGSITVIYVYDEVKQDSDLQDGYYNTTAETGAAMFKVVKTELIVNGDDVKAVLTLSGQGYDYLYAGTGAQADEDKANWVKAVPVTCTINGETKEWYTYTIPVDPSKTTIPVASHSEKNNRWYDRQVTIDYANLNKTAADGEYSIDVYTGAAMFKVVKATVNIINGEMTATVTLSGTGYDKLYYGTKDEAENDDASAIPFEVNAEGKYTYTFKIDALDEELPMASHSIAKDLWYDRTMVFQSETMEKIGDAKEDEPEEKPDGPGVNDGKEEEESKHDKDESHSTSAVDNTTGLEDGVYTPDSFSWSGGTGKVSILCPKVTVKNGQAYATIVFTSPKYIYCKASGNTYYPTVKNGTSEFTIPVTLNKNNTIVGCTTAMTAAHEISYQIFVYIAAAGEGGEGGMLGSSDELDDEAPEIPGLTYESEVEFEYAKFVKIFNYEGGISLVEIDMTGMTAFDPAKESEEEQEEAEETDADEKETGVIITDEGVIPEERSLEEYTAALYKNDIVKYMVVPEDATLPAGLEKQVIIIRQPSQAVYTDSAATVENMDALGVKDLLKAFGMQQDDNELLKDVEDFIFAGTCDDMDYKAFIKAQIDLAIFDGNMLPLDAEAIAERDDKSVEEVCEALGIEVPSEDDPSAEEVLDIYNTLSDRMATLGTAMIVDRSAVEESLLGTIEWIKVYGVIFGQYEKAEQIFKDAVEANK